MHKYYEYYNKIISKLVPHNITCMYLEQQILSDLKGPRAENGRGVKQGLVLKIVYL